MKIITGILILIYNVIFINGVLKHKNIFGLGTIINFSVNFNFFMYLLGWSHYIDQDPHINTYILINSIIIIFIIIMIFSKTPMSKIHNRQEYISIKKVVYGDKNFDIYTLINIIYIFLFLIENYMGSGCLIPNILGIDIHTYSAPLISFITRAIYVMLFLNYICYERFKKKRYLIFFFIDCILFPLIRGARLNIFISLVQFSIFYFMYNLDNILKYKRKLIGAIIIAVVIGISAVYIGNSRIDEQLEGNDLQGNIEYSDYIRYSGPEDPIGILPWYYGYFPMSYANLNLTIQSIENRNIRTKGIFSLRPILVGMLQFDNLIPEYPDINYFNSIRKYYTTAATVGTGFGEFYMDFGIFAFIPILIYASISLYFYNTIRRNIYYIAIYSCIAGAWFFMAFQNTMIDVVTLYSILYLYIIKRCFISIKNIKDKCVEIKGI